MRVILALIFLYSTINLVRDSICIFFDRRMAINKVKHEIFWYWNGTFESFFLYRANYMGSMFVPERLNNYHVIGERRTERESPAPLESPLESPLEILWS